MTKKLPFFLLFCLSIQVLPAQQKVILESIRCRSSRGPVMAYWQNTEIRKSFGGHLNSFLLKYYHAALSDTDNLKIEVLVANGNFNTPLYTSKGDTANLHMYINIFENTTRGFFLHAAAGQEDSALMARAKSVFQLQFILIKKDSVVVDNALDIIVSAGNTPGMGILSNTISLTPRGFTEMLKAGMNILMDPANEQAQIEMKVAPAFLADNYIITKTIQQPRTYITTQKDISTYTYKGKTEMIRSGEALYQEIIRNGKKADKLGPVIDEAIRNTYRASFSDYVFLRQDGRDVIRNKNYLLKLLVQIDPENKPENPALMFTNFVVGNIHYLFNDQDTIAIFAIERAVTDPVKKVSVNKISNGFDSVSYLPIDAKEVVWPVVYDYVVKGKIAGHGFSIKCSGFGNTLKEIYLDDTLICIAQGKFNPERFVIFDASLSSGLLNPLLMIGFNRFFE